MECKAWRLVLVACLLVAGCGAEVPFSFRLIGPAGLNTPRVVLIDAGVPFDESSGRTLRGDVYRPAWADGPTPLIIVIFGGSWRNGDRSQLQEFAYDFAANGYAAAAIDYRPAGGDDVFPAQVVDVLRAIQFFRVHAGVYNIDPDRMATFGASSGGHLALMAGLPADASVFDPGLPSDLTASVKAVVNFFGPTDLTVEPPAGFAFQIPVVENFLGAPFEEAGALRAAASPVRYVRPDGPPVFILHGTGDGLVPVSQARLLRDALDGAGVENVYIEVPSLPHIIGAVWFLPPAQIHRGALFGFLGAHL